MKSEEKMTVKFRPIRSRSSLRQMFIYLIRTQNNYVY